MLAAARMSRIVLMVRSGGDGLTKATEFYHQGLGLTIVRATDEWTELLLTPPPIENANTTTTTTLTNPPISLSLQAVSSEAQVTTGYSPILHFTVHDLDQIVARCVQMGAQMDGPIQFPAHGKVAALRSPDGHMIGLYEPSME